MGRNKMIAKSCPKCETQVAVATKACKCGHAFFTSRKGSGTSSGAGARNSSPVSEERRRTARVRRARPHFYDSQDYQSHTRKSNKRRSASQGSYDDEDYRRDRSKDLTTAQRAARRRALKLRLAADSHNVKSSTERPLPPASLQRCATLLSEINRKIVSVTWTPAPAPIDMPVDKCEAAD